MAFDKLDKDDSDVITVSDLVGVYDHTKHPKFLSGEWNKMKVIRIKVLSIVEIDNCTRCQNTDSCFCGIVDRMSENNLQTK